MKYTRSLGTFVVFTDLLFNLLFGIIYLFVLAFIQIHPPAHQADVKMQTQAIIQLNWDSKSSTDLDLWVRGPDGTVVGYPMKDGRYMHLDRDDLGASNDTIKVNGVEQVIPINEENLSVTDLIPGEYVVNVHYYHGTAPIENPTISIQVMNPYRIIWKGTLPIVNQQEETFVSFVVYPDGSISDIRTDIQVPIRSLQQ